MIDLSQRHRRRGSALKQFKDWRYSLRLSLSISIYIYTNTENSHFQLKFGGDFIHPQFTFQTQHLIEGGVISINHHPLYFFLGWELQRFFAFIFFLLCRLSTFVKLLKNSLLFLRFGAVIRVNFWFSVVNWSWSCRVYII